MINPHTLQSGVLLFLFLLCSEHAVARPEVLLMQALNAIQTSEMNKAEKVLKKLIKDEPDFKLAHLMYADLLKAKVNPLSRAGMGITASDELDGLLAEVKVRYEANQHAVNGDGKLPEALSRLDDNYRYAFVIDLKQSRLFVFKNDKGHVNKVADYYVSMGRSGAQKEKKGDLRTPLGVYFVQSHISPDDLADKYGAGAYPINYPNAWDNFNQRTGSGIWLHGTFSGTYNRPPLASEGCVVLANDDLIELGDYITLQQTPVLIGYDLRWLNAKQWQQQSDEMTALFDQWIDDWQSLNVENYLGHYSQNFDNGKKDYQHWASHKKRVAKVKTYIKVRATDVSLLKHPNEDVLVATFNQTYQSDNYSGQSWKRQYWRKEKDDHWRIIYEDEVVTH